MVTSRRERRFFKLARETGKKSDHYKANIGAVIVNGNHVISRGFNQKKTHPRQHWYDRLMDYHGGNSRLHAEISALINAGRTDLTGSSIYIYREDRLGSLLPCRPCVSCTQALKDAGVRHIYYTHKEGYAYERF